MSMSSQGFPSVRCRVRILPAGREFNHRTSRAPLLNRVLTVSPDRSQIKPDCSPIHDCTQARSFVFVGAPALRFFDAAPGRLDAAPNGQFLVAKPFVGKALN